MNWISVKDSLPKDKSLIMLTKYLTFFIGKYRLGNYEEMYPEKYLYRCDISGRFSNEISHWMELPKLPNLINT